MTFFLGDRNKSRTDAIVPIAAISLFVLLISVLAVFIFSKEPRPSAVGNLEPPKVKDAPALVESDITLKLSVVAESYDLSPEPFIRLASYLNNTPYSGIGIYRVKVQDAKILREDVLSGVIDNYEDDIQSAMMAAHLLSMYKKSGFSEPLAYVAYVYGPRQVNFVGSDPELQNFLVFCFGSDWKTL